MTDQAKSVFNSLLCGYISGALLAWIGVLITRSLWDQKFPLSSMEFWVAIIFSVCWLMVHPSLSAPRLWLKRFLYVLGGIVGGALIIAWNIQMVSVHSVYSSEQQANSWENTASVMNALRQAPRSPQQCDTLNFVWDHGVNNNKAWRMSIHDKMFLRDYVFDMHRFDCISDEQIFNMVQMLRVRTTKEPQETPALLMWGFESRILTTKYTYAENQFLPITRFEWCTHQIDKKMPAVSASVAVLLNDKKVQFCQALPKYTEVILAPEDVSGLNTFISHIEEQS